MAGLNHRILMYSKIFINGRLLNRGMSGVNRYTSEIIKRFGEKTILLKPSSFLNLGRGIFWEQFYLPARLTQNSLLWSPANSGPLLISNQVVTIHDLIPIEYPEWFTASYSAWYRFVLPRLSKKVQKIITDSEYSKSRILEILDAPDDKVVVIPAGVGNEFHPVELNQINEVISKFIGFKEYFLAVGSIEPRKNLIRLIKAWRTISARYNDLQLIIIGKRANSAREVPLSSPMMSVKFLEHIDDRHLPALYSGALGLMFPSLYEGFGLPALEAMACGTPVIAANNTSIPEVVGEAGLLFDPYDTDEIISSMQKIINDSEFRTELSRMGLKRAQHFTWDHTAEKVWEVLDMVAQEGQV